MYLFRYVFRDLGLVDVIKEQAVGRVRLHQIIRLDGLNLVRLRPVGYRLKSLTIIVYQVKHGTRDHTPFKVVRLRLVKRVHEVGFTRPRSPTENIGIVRIQFQEIDGCRLLRVQISARRKIVQSDPFVPRRNLLQPGSDERGSAAAAPSSATIDNLEAGAVADLAELNIRFGF